MSENYAETAVLVDVMNVDLDAVRARLADFLPNELSEFEAQVETLLDMIGAEIYRRESVGSGEAWKYGDVHECPMFGHRHPASTDCVTYALEHGDRLYQPDAR